MATAKHEYKGHCNHEMIHNILVDHKADLSEHEADALKKLRFGIHEIVKGIENLKVTIYLEGKIEAFIITNEKGENELILQFKANGDIDFRWTAKTLKQKTKEFVVSFATTVVNKTIEILTLVVTNGIVKGVEKLAEKAWKQIE